jgi:hypothetical protein
VQALDGAGNGRHREKEPLFVVELTDLFLQTGVVIRWGKVDVLLGRKNRVVREAFADQGPEVSVKVSGDVVHIKKENHLGPLGSAFEVLKLSEYSRKIVNYQHSAKPV